jgi:hypothetical protein
MIILRFLKFAQARAVSTQAGGAKTEPTRSKMWCPTSHQLTVSSCQCTLAIQNLEPRPTPKDPCASPDVTDRDRNGRDPGPPTRTRTCQCLRRRESTRMSTLASPTANFKLNATCRASLRLSEWRTKDDRDRACRHCQWHENLRSRTLGHRGDH